MKAIINDSSFTYKFFSREAAIKAYHEWLDICKELMKQRVRRVQQIYSDKIDTSLEAADGYKIIQLVQEFQDREDRRRLLGLLMNSPACNESGKSIYIDGKKSKAGTAAYEDGLLISLNSNVIFADEKIKGKCGDEEVEIDNLAKMEYIRFHSGKLGIRYYEPNKKHGAKAYVRPGGMTASEMDLPDDIAQIVLDHSVEVNGHLYGCCNDNFYEFRKTEKNTYHGYKNKVLSKEIKKRILESCNCNLKS